MTSRTPLPWFFAVTGTSLLALSLLPILDLPLDSPGAKLWVWVLLLLCALLAPLLLMVSRIPKRQVLIALLPVGLAFFLRSALLGYVSDDYQIFLAQWVAALRDNGGFAAVKLPIGNYNAPYLLFLAAISYLPLPDLFLIKFFSICFDVVLAWGGLRLTVHFTGRESCRPLICFCALLLLPTVVLNGSMWGQCDALYGALALHAAADALGGRPRASALWMGVAFSFKLQTVFLLPLWGAFWFTGRVKMKHLLFFPIGYAVPCLPALLLGKPLGDILGVYLGQTQEGVGALNYNCASLYSLLPYGAQVDETVWARGGILAAFALVLVLLGILLVFRRRTDDHTLLLAGVILTIGVPFLLPYMHDRYYFLADVLTLAWACAFPRRFPAALLVQLASLSAYLVYFRQKYTLLLSLGGQTYTMLGESLLVLTALIWCSLLLGVRLAREKSDKNPNRSRG